MTDRYCTNCHSIRLSVADAGDTCIFCQADVEAPTRPRAASKNFCACGRPRAYKTSARCVVCARAYVVRWRALHSHASSTQSKRSPGSQRTKHMQNGVAS